MAKILESIEPCASFTTQVVLQVFQTKLDALLEIFSSWWLVRVTLVVA